MAKKTVTVYYKPSAPFVGVNVPGAQPSVVIMRGESAVLDKKLADDFRARLKAGKIIDLTEDHFEFVEVAEAAAEVPKTGKKGGKKGAKTENQPGQEEE